MDNSKISEACRNIYRKYPEFNGVSPKVSAQPGDRALLVFSSNAKTADGKSIARTLRVVIDAAGRIVKATTSR